MDYTIRSLQALHWTPVYWKFCILAFALTSFLPAATVTYDLSGLNGIPATVPVTSGIANLTEGDISRGSGVTAIVSNDTFASSQWHNQNTVDLNDYYSILLTPDSGFILSLNSITFTHQSSFQGPTQFALRTSLDAFVSNFATGTTGTTANRDVINFSPSFNNLSSAIEIRIYGFAAANNGTNSQWWLGAVPANATNPNPNNYVSNITFDLTTTAGVPEPTTAALLISAALATSTLKRRRRS